jgi:lipopolysaccharide/colanic/teichoic acid biosynthesis glycosyltransferase
MTHIAKSTGTVPAPLQPPPLPSAINISVNSRHLGSNTAGRLLAVLCLLPGLPLMAALMTLVKLTSRGSALYTQQRVGRHGEIFTMYKLRSMVPNAEAETGPTWAGPEDPRVTGFGRFLRASHLDELPQLLNVVRGEMAIFGPRPERPEIVQSLAEQIPGYLNRLAVLPGITGLAQINLPPDETVDCVRKKLYLDLQYIQTGNWLLDVQMFFWTLLRLVMVPAGIATGLMGLERSVPEVAATGGLETEDAELERDMLPDRQPVPVELPTAAIEETSIPPARFRRHATPHTEVTVDERLAVGFLKR